MRTFVNKYSKIFEFISIYANNFMYIGTLKILLFNYNYLCQTEKS